ncbi:GstD1 (predicted) [Pycnogonum litorale]
MGNIDLYYMQTSAPCRSVLMVAKHLNLKLNLKTIDLMKDEHKKPEFIKINPAHVIPTIVDDGFILWESRAILEYMTDKYDICNRLMPIDIEGKATVRKFLNFDGTSLYKAVGDYFYPQMFQKQDGDAKKLKELKSKINILQDMMEDNSYVCGDVLTIADLSILATLTTLELSDFDITEYQKVDAWIKRLKNELPYYEETNGDGIHMFRQMLKKVRK